MAVHYHSEMFPPTSLNWMLLLPKIGPANAAIAHFGGVLRSVPNPTVLLAPLTTQEAVLSSRIEGTQATLGEVLEAEAEGLSDESTPKSADIREVVNCRIALLEASQDLKKLPLSQRLIKNAHKRLMSGVRGRNKSPGAYRRIPNWIGPHGCTIEEARFIPCAAEQVPNEMSEWESYLHSEQHDKLVQLAIAHAEFEAIHPFLDGNGRLGRLLVPLFLKENGLLAYPSFYVSEFFEAHKSEYYDRLLAVSRDNDWNGWVLFFLRAIILQASANEQKALSILNLYDRLKEKVVEWTRSQYAVRALDWFFCRPIFKTTDFSASVNIPAPTATRILRIVREHGLLKEIRAASGRRPAVLAFSELLDITEKPSEF